MVDADAYLAELDRLYALSETRLRTLIAQAIHSGALGTATYRQRQLTFVEQILEQMHRQAVPVAVGAVSSGYSTGALATDRTLDLDRAFGGVHERAVAVLAENIVEALGNAARTVGRQAEDVFRRVGLEEVAIGLAEGESGRTVAKAIEDRLLHEGVTAFVDRSGAHWRLSTYSRMVAVTTTREAVSTGTANRLIENGNDLITISKHPHPADICTPWEGRTFSLTGETEGYALAELPPYHPWCRHVATPAAVAFEDFERELGVDPEEPPPEPPEAAPEKIPDDEPLAPQLSAVEAAVLERAKPEKGTYFHGTAESNVEAIRKGRLTPSAGGFANAYGSAVYLTGDRAEAETRGTALRVDIDLERTITAEEANELADEWGLMYPEDFRTRLLGLGIEAIRIERPSRTPEERRRGETVTWLAVLRSVKVARPAAATFEAFERELGIEYEDDRAPAEPAPAPIAEDNPLLEPIIPPAGTEGFAPPPFSRAAIPERDEESSTREADQAVIYGDPGPEAETTATRRAAEDVEDADRLVGPEKARLKVERAALRAENKAIDQVLGPDLVAALEDFAKAGISWLRDIDFRRALAAGDVDVDYIMGQAETELAEIHGRRYKREELKDLDGLTKRQIPCFVCGRFKRRPADVCDHCGDDPVSHGGNAAEFNRAYGYEG